MVKSIKKVMKELSIEQKAKAYDEAIEKAKSKILYTDKPCFVNIKEIFPELAESEDEKIRKWIIAYLENRVMNTSITDEKDNCLDAIRWLEKQGETSPIVSNSSKIGKPAWSEEDEDNLNSAIYYIRREPYYEEKVEPIVNWLKSLKPQNRWKPSDEQMEALLYEVNAWDEDSANGQNLKSLYQDLKKLMEE